MYAKKINLRKTTSILLTLVLLIGMIMICPIRSYAEEPEDPNLWQKLNKYLSVTLDTGEVDAELFSPLFNSLNNLPV